jgi:hypothetical protein
VDIGDTVLVQIDADVRRPMILTKVGLVEIFTRPSDTQSRTEFRVSGILFCEPDDHTCAAFRGGIDRVGDPAAISGRPDRVLPVGYGEALSYGTELGQWIPRPRSTGEGH